MATNLIQNELLRVPYKQVDGTEIPTDVYLPLRKATGDHALAPVLIMCHGGGFIVGWSRMNNADTIEDCLERGWIVLSIEYRLCPGVDLVEGPMTDARDVLRWVQTGGLATALEKASTSIRPDPERVMAMGASAGGHLALSMAWDVEKPPLAILDFYGPKMFDDPFWLRPIEEVRSRLPSMLPDSAFEHLYQEKTVFMGGISLEGQRDAAGPTRSVPMQPNLNDKRQLFAMQAIAQGKVLRSIWPAFPNGLDRVDPARNVHKDWPPTAIVHGTADTMVPMHLSQAFEGLLKEQGVETEFIEVEDEPHTFLGKMVKGSKTWDTQRRGFDFLERILRLSYP
ncbi:Alpha/beta hydrolase fold-3 [Penicillium occitanis (nom. inval.)]|nr:Alpha/beta hydrolase fold-3 [Penicillium occitanis (nom. inval.)]PCH07258.1 hypothetical protein PENOC_019990 [Penicillium occitanis (nom. inval.)]